MPRERKDYCGPYWLHPKIRRLLSIKFNASCKIHDEDYENAIFTQKQADRRFISHTLRQSKGNILWILVGVLMYIGVRLGGWISYGKK